MNDKWTGMLLMAIGFLIQWKVNTNWAGFSIFAIGFGLTAYELNRLHGLKNLNKHEVLKNGI